MLARGVLHVVYISIKRYETAIDCGGRWMEGEVLEKRMGNGEREARKCNLYTGRHEPTTPDLGNFDSRQR